MGDRFQGVFPPDSPAYPPELHGRRFIALAGVYAGAVEMGKVVLEPLRNAAEPLADFSGPMPYVEVQRFFDADYPIGWHYYWKSAQPDAARRCGDPYDFGARQPAAFAA